MKKTLFILFTCISLSLFAQADKTAALARQYYTKGDYDKAAQLYEELWKDNPSSTINYTYLFNSLIRINEYEKLEGIVKKMQKKYKTDVSYIVDMGYIHSQNNEAKKAEEIYEEALQSLEADENSIRKLASKFTAFRQEDYTIKTYLKGNELLNSDTKFAYELGNAYLKKDDPKNAVNQWLEVIKTQPNRKSSVQNILANNIEKTEIAYELETQLYGYIQKEPTREEYPEMLIWLFLHQKDYESALLQAKAMDKRNNENGYRIYTLSKDALREDEYNAAIEGFQYLLDKGENTQFYHAAQTEQLKARKLKVTTTPNYSDEDLAVLHTSFEDYISRFGKSTSTASTVRDLAHLEANYLHNIDNAISLLNELIVFPNLPKKVKNETKLDLGDYYILKGDVWEATLLYAQVDKDEKDSPLGEDARYRNAKLSYYKGEFEWAQAQLSILKGATTELIANDALDLSVFIIDNLGLDTTTTSMEMYARAELKSIQNKNEEAVNVLDSILTLFPDHALKDDILYKQAQIAKEEREYEKSIGYLDEVIKNHGEDILADNAAFLLGDIYQNYLNNTEKAMEYYLSIITEYSDSVLVVEARKRYRNLRGDTN